MGRAMASPLEDPETARFAWRRFRRLMLGMGLVTFIAVASTLALFHRDLAAASIHLYIATGLGLAMAMMLTAALMGLTFLSHGTGHDAAIDEDQAGGDERR